MSENSRSLQLKIKKLRDTNYVLDSLSDDECNVDKEKDKEDDASRRRSLLLKIKKSSDANYMLDSLSDEGCDVDKEKDKENDAARRRKDVEKVDKRKRNLQSVCTPLQR